MASIGAFDFRPPPLPPPPPPPPPAPPPPPPPERPRPPRRRLRRPPPPSVSDSASLPSFAESGAGIVSPILGLAFGDGRRMSAFSAASADFGLPSMARSGI